MIELDHNKLDKASFMYCFADLVPYVDNMSWHEIADQLTPDQLRNLERVCTSWALHLALMGIYLSQRGISGSMDRGHDKALDIAVERGKAIRKALGYAYP